MNISAGIAIIWWLLTNPYPGNPFGPGGPFYKGAGSNITVGHYKTQPVRGHIVHR